MSDYDFSGLLELDPSDYVSGADEAAEASEGVVDSTGDVSDSLFDLEPAGIAAGGALAGIGTAAQSTLDETRDLRESLGRTGVSMDITTDEANSLARSMSDATFPLGDVTATMDSLAQQGIESEETMQDVATAADDIADATGTTAESVADNLGPAIEALGGDLEDMEDYSDAFTLAVRDSNLETEDLAQTIERSSEELNEMGLGADDAAGLISEYADQTGKSGRRASRDFARAVRDADGDLDALVEETGLSQDALAEWSEELEDSEGITQEYADAANESVSTMDRLRARMDDAQLAASGYLEPLSALGPMAQTAGIGLMGLSTINVSAVAPSFATVAAAAAPITATVLGIAGAAALLHKAWDSNFLGIQNVTQDAFARLGEGWDWLTGKFGDGVDWIVDKVLTIPDVVGDIVDAIPGVDSEDVLGDVDIDSVTDSMFPDKPGEEGEDVGEAMAEGAADGAAEAADGTAFDPDEPDAAAAMTPGATGVSAVSGGDVEIDDAPEPDIPEPDPEPATESAATQPSGGGRAPSADEIVDRLEQILTELRAQAGPVEITDGVVRFDPGDGMLEFVRGIVENTETQRHRDFDA